MAIDKAVDSSFLDGGLNNIAAAIRDKTGKSDFLAFPDDFVTEISGITGGGGGESKIAYGTFTPTVDTYNYEVIHELGVIPDFIIVWSSDAKATSTKKGVLAIGVNKILNGFAQWFLRYRNSYYDYFAKTGIISVNHASHPFFKVNETSFEVFDSSLANYAVSGVTYGWVAIKGIEQW